MIKKIVSNPMLRYGIVGLSANVAMYLGYLSATHLGLPPAVAMTILYACGTLSTFYFNRVWTFHANLDRYMLVRYTSTYAIGYVLNLGLLTTLTKHLAISHECAQAVCIIVVAILLFILMRKWVFPGRNKF